MNSDFYHVLLLCYILFRWVFIPFYIHNRLTAIDSLHISDQYCSSYQLTCSSLTWRTFFFTRIASGTAPGLKNSIASKLTNRFKRVVLHSFIIVLEIMKRSTINKLSINNTGFVICSFAAFCKGAFREARNAAALFGGVCRKRRRCRLPTFAILSYSCRPCQSETDRILKTGLF